MDSPWLIAYLVLAGAAIVQSLLVAAQAWENRRFSRAWVRGLERHRATGRACVLVPCKGIDEELEENLRAVLRQDYPDFEVVFILEAADDPAGAVIRRVMAEHPQAASRLLVAGRATSSGQKVHNLLAATARIAPEIAFLAFLDSDSQPRPEWLRMALARLGRPIMGAATSYRWLLPRRPTLANSLLASINGAVMALSSRRHHRLVWGGSWASRRDTFDRLDLRQKWQGTLSDDLVASRVLRRAGLRVRFEPGCVVASPLDRSPREMFAFLRRQYLIVRHYAPLWWWFALANSSIRNLAWLVSLGLAVCGLLRGAPSAWLAGAVLAALYALDLYRGSLAEGMARACLGDRSLPPGGWPPFHLWLAPAAGLVNWLGILTSAFGRVVTWRGVRYRLLRGGRVAVTSRDDPPRAAPHPQPQATRKAA
jgi:glycosyltransferase involved in cell wall biosynthesis